MHGKWICAVILSVFLSSSVLCQSPDTSPERKIAIGINFFYFHPNLGDLNAGFSRIEKLDVLPTWNDYKIYYLVLPTITYQINPKMQALVEFGGSYVAQVREDSKSFYGLWMIGGKYRYMPISWNNPPVEVWASLGVGILEAEFYRSYGNDVGVNAVGRKMYIDIGAEGRWEATKRLDVNVNLRYLIVPSMKFANLQSKLSLSSFAVGVGFSYSL